MRNALVVHRDCKALLGVDWALRGVHGKVPRAGHIHALHRSFVVAVAFGGELYLGRAHIHHLHRKSAIHLSVSDRLRMAVGDMQREGHRLDHAGMVGRNLQFHVPRTGLAGSRRGRGLLLLFRHTRFLATTQSKSQTQSENRTGQPT